MMMAVLVTIWHLKPVQSVIRGTISGVFAAAVVDVHAFLTWKDAHEAVTYNWSMARLRWMQGAVSGALTGAGLGQFLP